MDNKAPLWLGLSLLFNHSLTITMVAPLAVNDVIKSIILVHIQPLNSSGCSLIKGNASATEKRGFSLALFLGLADLRAAGPASIWASLVGSFFFSVTRVCVCVCEWERWSGEWDNFPVFSLMCAQFVMEGRFVVGHCCKRFLNFNVENCKVILIFIPILLNIAQFYIDFLSKKQHACMPLPKTATF